MTCKVKQMCLERLVEPSVGAQGARHEQKSRPTTCAAQAPQRQLPGSATLGIAEVMELVHDHLEAQTESITS